MGGERIAQTVFLLAAVLSASVTVLLLAFMVILGLPLFQGGLFVSILTQPWLPGRQLFGVWPMIVGTLAIAALAVAVAFPLSLGVSSLIAVVAPRRIARLVKSAVAFMTGIPTVVYGFVGFFCSCLWCAKPSPGAVRADWCSRGTAASAWSWCSAIRSPWMP